MMSKPIQYAPQTFLFGASITGVNRALKSFIEIDPECTAVNADFKCGVNTEILYRGVSVMVSVSRPINGMSQFKNIFCNAEPA